MHQRLSKYLLEDLGYTGFRYDMTKGYSASFTAQYNKASGTKFSVGEYWDGNTTTLKNWVDGTKDNGTIMSAAFDFPFRYTVRDAISGSNWSKLSNKSNPSLMKTIGYSQYSVTFVENHDTQYRSATDQQDPIRKDTLAANAYLLAMPGTPCVFLPHWKAYKQEIKAMIDARKAAGITNNSRTVELRNTIATYLQVRQTERKEILLLWSVQKLTIMYHQPSSRKSLQVITTGITCRTQRIRHGQTRLQAHTRRLST